MSGPIPLEQVFVAMGVAAFGSLFAAGDAALSSLPEARLHVLAQEQGARGQAFERYTRDRVRILSRWLVARVAAISSASALLAEVASDTWSGAHAGWMVAVFGAVLVYGTSAELLCTLGRRRPELIGIVMLRYLRWTEWIVAPLAEPLAYLGWLINRRVPPAPNTDSRLAETEVEWAIKEGERSGAIALEPAEIIRNVLEFKDLSARDVMVPRRKVSGFELTTPIDEVLKQMARNRHSRYPVYRETLDNIVGLLYAKDLFSALRENRRDLKVVNLVRKPVLFVVESQSAISILREMRSRRLHMALVSDDFGGTSGLVTLEDIIEEIIGEIQDEYDDVREAPIEEVGHGRFVADASMPISDLETKLGRPIASPDGFESLGGLILHHEGRVPPVGTKVKLDGVELIVREADEARVVKVEIVKTVPPPPPALVAS